MWSLCVCVSFMVWFIQRCVRPLFLFDFAWKKEKEAENEKMSTACRLFTYSRARSLAWLFVHYSSLLSLALSCISGWCSFYFILFTRTLFSIRIAHTYGMLCLRCATIHYTHGCCCFTKQCPFVSWCFYLHQSHIVSCYHDCSDGETPNINFVEYHQTRTIWWVVCMEYMHSTYIQICVCVCVSAYDLLLCMWRAKTRWEKKKKGKNQPGTDRQRTGEQASKRERVRNGDESDDVTIWATEKYMYMRNYV